MKKANRVRVKQTFKEALAGTACFQTAQFLAAAHLGSKKNCHAWYLGFHQLSCTHFVGSLSAGKQDGLLGEAGHVLFTRREDWAVYSQ